MRTKNLFRSLMAAGLAVISMSAFGQTTAGTADQDKGADALGNGPAGNEWVDIVTVGSTMPYNIVKDINIENLVTNGGGDFQSSVFNWTLSGGGTMTQTDGSPIANVEDDQDVANPGFSVDGSIYYPNHYTVNEILVEWGTTAGTYNLSVQEQSQNSIGLEACVGPKQDLNIWVMEKPTVTLTEANFQAVNILTAPQFIGNSPTDGKVGGCGVADVTGAPGAAPTNIYLPLTITGVDQFLVKYKVAYTNLANVGSDLGLGYDGTTTLTTATKFDAGTNDFLALASSGSGFTKTTNDGTNTALSADNTELVVTVPVGTYGKFVVTLESISDRISRKSFALAADYENAASGSSITIWSLPTPSTGRIKHVSNFDNAGSAW